MAISILKTQRRGNISFKLIISVLLVAVFVSGLSIHVPQRSPQAEASVLPYLPGPTKLIERSPEFNLARLHGIKLYPHNPFKFDFIIEEGDKTLSQEEFNRQSSKLISYFLASLTIPQEDLWVNLSPYEKDTIIPDELGLTEMGRDLLGEDYILKQLMASLTYPESPLGKKFWEKVYKRAQELYGTTNLPINTFNKVWIVPEKATVYEDADKAFIGESKFKVMLEEDYLALNKNIHNPDIKKHNLDESEIKDISNFSSQIMKEIILPIIEEEVNTGKHFAYLRQIYHSLILATWFKQKLRQNILKEAYINKKKIKGIDTTDPTLKEKIYNQYITAFKKGVYDYIKQDFDAHASRYINRRYFSGGFSAEAIGPLVAGSAVDIGGLLPIQRKRIEEEDRRKSDALVQWQLTQPGKEDESMTASSAEGKRTASSAVGVEVDLDEAVLKMVKLSKLYRDVHAHGTNAQALLGILAMGGKVLPRAQLEKRGIKILSGESLGASDFNLNSVSTITLLSRGIAALEAIRYAWRTTMSMGLRPSNIDQKIQEAAYLLEKSKRQGRELVIPGGERFLTALRDAKEYFLSLSQREKEAIERNMSIPIVVIGFDSGEKQIYTSYDGGGIEGEARVEELTLTMIATERDHVEYVSSLLKSAGKDYIKVITMEEVLEFDGKFKKAMGMTPASIAELSTKEMEEIIQREREKTLREGAASSPLISTSDTEKDVAQEKVRAVVEMLKRSRVIDFDNKRKFEFIGKGTNAETYAVRGKDVVVQISIRGKERYFRRKVDFVRDRRFKAFRDAGLGITAGVLYGGKVRIDGHEGFVDLIVADRAKSTLAERVFVLLMAQAVAHRYFHNTPDLEAISGKRRAVKKQLTAIFSEIYQQQNMKLSAAVSEALKDEVVDLLLLFIMQSGTIEELEVETRRGIDEDFDAVLSKGKGLMKRLNEAGYAAIDVNFFQNTGFDSRDNLVFLDFDQKRFAVFDLFSDKSQEHWMGSEEVIKYLLYPVYVRDDLEAIGGLLKLDHASIKRMKNRLFRMIVEAFTSDPGENADDIRQGIERKIQRREEELYALTALKKKGFSAASSPLRFADEAFAKEVLQRLVTDNLRQAFAPFNGARQPAQVILSGDAMSLISALPQELDKLTDISDDEFIVVALHRSEDQGEGSIESKFQIVIDRLENIKAYSSEVALGRFDLETCDFVLDFTIFHPQNHIHLETLSIGRANTATDVLKGQGITSSVFKEFAAVLKENCQGMIISTMPIEREGASLEGKFQVIPHWMEKYFNARDASRAEADKIKELGIAIDRVWPLVGRVGESTASSAAGDALQDEASMREFAKGIRQMEVTAQKRISTILDRAFLSLDCAKAVAQRLWEQGIPAEIYATPEGELDMAHAHLWVETKDFIIDVFPEGVWRYNYYVGKYIREEVVVLPKQEGKDYGVYSSGVNAKVTSWSRRLRDIELQPKPFVPVEERIEEIAQEAVRVQRVANAKEVPTRKTRQEIVTEIETPPAAKAKEGEAEEPGASSPAEEEITEETKEVIRKLFVGGTEGWVLERSEGGKLGNGWGDPSVTKQDDAYEIALTILGKKPLYFGYFLDGAVIVKEEEIAEHTGLSAMRVSGGYPLLYNEAEVKRIIEEDLSLGEKSFYLRFFSEEDKQRLPTQGVSPQDIKHLLEVIFGEKRRHYGVVTGLGELGGKLMGYPAHAYNEQAIGVAFIRDMDPDDDNDIYGIGYLFKTDSTDSIKEETLQLTDDILQTLQEIDAIRKPRTPSNWRAEFRKDKKLILRRRLEEGKIVTEDYRSPTERSASSAVGELDKRESSLPATPGGIDLTNNHLDIEVKGEGIYPLESVPFDMENFEGFSFKIIKIERLNKWAGKEGGEDELALLS
ncbi:MAG: hypothetical protein JSW17_02510 [Candidatus Omnitrophota bacterium]|nr:MAG: hypothetical protein JSW17_02510 [Candidatus Omnitrophota bacterium]